MFYDAGGGRKITGAWNRYQHFVDLSHALDSDTAMLVGLVSEPRSELMRVVPGEEGEPVPASMRGSRDNTQVVYRFLLPVGPSDGAESDEPASEATADDSSGIEGAESEEVPETAISEAPDEESPAEPSSESPPEPAIEAEDAPEEGAPEEDAPEEDAPGRDAPEEGATGEGAPAPPPEA